MNQSDAIEQIVRILVRQHTGPGGEGERLRKASGTPASVIGKYAGATPETVTAWEQGTVTPTTGQALAWLGALYDSAARPAG